MNRMLDLGEMPDEPIVKANESMNGQFRPDNMMTRDGSVAAVFCVLKVLSTSQNDDFE